MEDATVQAVKYVDTTINEFLYYDAKDLGIRAEYLCVDTVSSLFAYFLTGSLRVQIDN